MLCLESALVLNPAKLDSEIWTSTPILSNTSGMDVVVKDVRMPSPLVGSLAKDRKGKGILDAFGKDRAGSIVGSRDVDQMFTTDRKFNFSRKRPIRTTVASIKSDAFGSDLELGAVSPKYSSVHRGRAAYITRGSGLIKVKAELRRRRPTLRRSWRFGRFVLVSHDGPLNSGLRRSSPSKLGAQK